MLVLESEQQVKFSNRASELVKFLRIESSFYTIIIKNYVAEHLKAYPYYSTFSLLLLLNLVKISSSLCSKWNNKKAFLKNLRNVSAEILSHTKELKISLTKEQILRNTEQTLHEFENSLISPSLISEILELLDFPDPTPLQLKIVSVPKLSFANPLNSDSENRMIKMGYVVKIDENQGNLKLIENFFDAIGNSLNFLKNNILILESGVIEIEEEKGSLLLQECFRKNVKILITNGTVSDLISFSFFGKNILIIGNVRLRKLREIGLFIGVKSKFYSEFINQKEVSFEQENKAIKTALIKNSEDKIYLVFTGLSEQPFYILPLPFISATLHKKTKKFIQTTIKKHLIFRKHQKGLAGAGVFELQLADLIRRKVKGKSQIVFRDEVRESLAVVFETIAFTLLFNEGFSILEVQSYLQNLSFSTDNKFFDEYKAKKFSIKSAFFHLNLILRSIFPAKTYEISSSNKITGILQEFEKKDDFTFK